MANQRILTVIFGQMGNQNSSIDNHTNSFIHFVFFGRSKSRWPSRNKWLVAIGSSFVVLEMVDTIPTFLPLQLLNGMEKRVGGWCPAVQESERGVTQETLNLRCECQITRLPVTVKPEECTGGGGGGGGSSRQIMEQCIKFVFISKIVSQAYLLAGGSGHFHHPNTNSYWKGGDRLCGTHQCTLTHVRDHCD